MWEFKDGTCEDDGCGKVGTVFGLGVDDGTKWLCPDCFDRIKEELYGW